MQLEGVLSKTEGVHENFRLWITAEPHSAFPIGLLQMGIKLTNEAPVGMQAGMRASYQWVNQVWGLCLSRRPVIDNLHFLFFWLAWMILLAWRKVSDLERNCGILIGHKP